MKFGDFIHTQKRDPQTNLKSPTMMWDFWSLSPESLHQVTILFSDRGTPDGFRHMNGYSSHTFSLINGKNELYYVKWHFKTKQGIKNFTREQADEMRGKDPDYAQRDLFESIRNGTFPKWRVCVQVMAEKEAETCHINPFDLTKVWPQKEYPLVEVGEMVLDRNPENYFAEVEQAAFEPRNIIPGMGYSPDKMLQGRLLSYGCPPLSDRRQLRRVTGKQAAVSSTHLQSGRRHALRRQLRFCTKLRAEQLRRAGRGFSVSRT